MKLAYAERGEQPPYRSIGSFRRAYRMEKGTEGYKKSHYFEQNLTDDLTYTLRNGKLHLNMNKAVFDKDTEYGRRHCVSGYIFGKNGNKLKVKSVWQVEKNSDKIRFITLTFPKEKND